MFYILVKNLIYGKYKFVEFPSVSFTLFYFYRNKAHRNSQAENWTFDFPYISLAQFSLNKKDWGMKLKNILRGIRITPGFSKLD